MSVLKNRRKESKMEYVNNAYNIYKETVQFLSRLSARYARLLAAHIVDLAANVLSNTEMVEVTKSNDTVALALRRQCLLKAQANLSALDVHLSTVYDILRLNPTGCFTTAKGKLVDGGKSMKRLESMADSLGLKISIEQKYLTNLLKNPIFKKLSD